ncbi:hypothetical protein A1O1_03096 [Capronia coronata CBS 617.96]|uniref:Uncharacterized protein n=1 Tax=Capronia coronata CBS 617.96 TaxID=1182541 RepID=W9ZJK2_9EURO|nr:uncharacterized protein A1O1_03096 [Capronia coronata CBS 617.96]EXJ94699.1 hypothetical protein A1O1_03096 [Capronia coronata CBS 617.96]
MSKRPNVLHVQLIELLHSIRQQHLAHFRCIFTHEGTLLSSSYPPRSRVRQYGLHRPIASRLKHQWMVNVQRVISTFPVPRRYLVAGRNVVRVTVLLSLVVVSDLSQCVFVRLPLTKVLPPSTPGLRRNLSQCKCLHEAVTSDSSTTYAVTPNESLPQANAGVPEPTPLVSSQSQSTPARSKVAPWNPFPESQNEAEAEREEACVATELDFDAEDDSVDRHTSRQLSTFLPSNVRGKKVDLSYVNPVEWEESFIEDKASNAATFRSSTPLRKLVLDYLRKIEPAIRDPSVDWDSAELEDVLAQNLRSTFDTVSLEVLATTGFDVADVASWSWIFSSQTVDLAVQRYTLLVEDLRRSQKPAMPKFVLLQLLRAHSISNFALKEIIKSILAELKTSQETKQYSGWGWITRVCLIVRLLRHARRVAPDCLGDISLIIGHLFSDYYGAERPLARLESSRLTHVFNRFLTLIALTPAKTPFNAYQQQQNAQLALVRLMVAFEPQLPITREGYRALITVQLLHRKTKHERIWAEAKAPSWPPWRQIRSGIEQDLEYPGKESRVMKLLGRMNEAGYVHGEWEKSAAVLAGWDTDKSPTIQTRSILTRPSRPWKTSPRRTNASEGPALWAARIRATRSRREAWASFCAYEKSTDPSRVQYLPYFAMLEKLLVQTVTTDSQYGAAYTPGDVKEVFEDSVNPRDLIYIERDVPSAEEFYQHMLRMGVKPGGSILSGLLKSAPNISAGFSYIQDSRWDELTKRVLRHAGDYSPTVIRQTLSTVPDHTLAALIGLLSRHGFEDEPEFRSTGESTFGGSNRPRANETTTPFAYAWELLNVGRSTNPRLWNALLEGSIACLMEARGMALRDNVDSWTVRDMKYGIWLRLWMTFGASSRPWHIHPDLETFRQAARIVSLLLKDRRLHVPTSRYSWFAKAIFLHAVYGRRITPFLPPATVPLLVVPEARDLQLLVRVLVLTHDVDGLVALVQWLNGHAKAFESLNKHQDVSSDDLEPSWTGHLPPLHNILCAIRLFLEGSPPRSVDGHDAISFETPLRVNSETIQEARLHCATLGWPTDAEIELFLSRDGNWIRRVAHDAELAASRRPKRDHQSENKLSQDGPGDTGAHPYGIGESDETSRRSQIPSDESVC